MPSPITTHVLDTMRGVPASGIETLLQRQNADGDWQRLAQGYTNENGRITDLLPSDTALPPGLYRLTFHVSEYLAALGVAPVFFPVIRIEFAVSDGQARSHYHVPLLLSPFAYSTYLGS